MSSPMVRQRRDLPIPPLDPFRRSLETCYASYCPSSAAEAEVAAEQEPAELVDDCNELA